MLLRKLLLILLLCHLLFAAAQTPTGFVRYTTVDGLSGNYVTGLAQDATGYVWIATASGLNRFNGSRFVQFHSTADSTSLASEELTQLKWLDNSRLAVYSSTGLHVVNTRTGQTQNLFVPFHRQQYLYKFNIVHGARADDKGNLYLLTRSGFYHFVNNRLVWRFDYYKEENLDNTHFHFGGDLFDYSDQQLLLVTAGGLYLYDKETRQLRHVEENGNDLLSPFASSTNRRFLFFQRKAGELFVLTTGTDSLTYVHVPLKRRVVSHLPSKSGFEEFQWRSRLVAESDSVYYLSGHTAGLYKLHFDKKTGLLKFDGPKRFPGYLCLSLLCDKSGRLWVGTSKGLFRQEPGQDFVQTVTVPPRILDSFVNLRLAGAYATDGRLYAAARGEGGLLVFDKKTLRFERQLLFGKTAGQTQVAAMVPVKKGTLLLGTFAGPYFLNTQTQKATGLLPAHWQPGADWTNDVFKDSKGNVWLSASSNLYRRSLAGQGFETVPLNHPVLPLPVFIREDNEGKIWMASHGLARYNEKQHGFDCVVDSFPFLKMPDRQVSTFAFDKNNTLWFSSNNNGLLGYDLRTKSFRQFSTRNGLPDNQVNDVLPVGDKLWVACFSGLACLDVNTGTVVGFGREDGFPDGNIVRGTRLFYDSAAQQVYVPFSTALARFSPQQLLQRHSPPRLFIESLTLNGEENHYLPGTSFTAPWSRNDASVTIGCISYTAAANLRFAYRLLNEANAPWVSLGTQPQFNIAGLAPGQHHLQVRVCSVNNRWPEQVRDFYLDIEPPFWRTDWFIGVTSALLLFGVYELVRWRTSVVRRKERLKTQLQKLKADDYKAQFELEQISHYFSSSIAGKNTESDVLWDVARNLIGRLGYEDCIIYLWNESKTKMVQRAAYGPKGEPEIVKADAFTVSPGQGIVGHVIKSGQPVLVKDTRRDIRYRVDDEYRLSELAVPILHEGELLGVIDSENSQLGYFSERDVQVLTTIATLIGNKLKQLQSEQELEAKQEELAGINEQLAEARLSALQAQMNPHFVFNALNSIKRMILDGDNDKASRYLSKFALMIRMTLEQSKAVFVTLDENIAYLNAYLEMERLRFDESFSYSITADEEIDSAETLLPSMMIQPLVENAIWHGLLQAGEDKKLRIDFVQKKNRLACMVEDNGIGYQQAEKLRKVQRPLHRSAGLENLQKRIRIINEKYSTEAVLYIVDRKETGDNGSGTKAVLEMNLMSV